MRDKETGALLAHAELDEVTVLLHDTFYTAYVLHVAYDAAADGCFLLLHLFCQDQAILLFQNIIVAPDAAPDLSTSTNNKQGIALARELFQWCFPVYTNPPPWYACRCRCVVCVFFNTTPRVSSISFCHNSHTFCFFLFL